MTVVSDASPLISLSKIGQLELLPQLYHTVTITPEVYVEVAVSGAGLAGSSQIATAPWIEVKQVNEAAVFSAAKETYGLGMGELSVIVFSRETKADLVLLDERKARRLARDAGLTVLGCVGILEDAFLQKLLPDLRDAYRQLLVSGAYINARILSVSLENLNLPPL